MGALAAQRTPLSRSNFPPQRSDRERDPIREASLQIRELAGLGEHHPRSEHPLTEEDRREIRRSLENGFRLTNCELEQLIASRKMPHLGAPHVYQELAKKQLPPKE